MSDNPDPFDQFWSAYPRRVAKGGARTAFAKAIKKTDIETILAAIADYISHKPGYQDFCHPQTWLNQERGDDDWTPPPIVRAPRANATDTFDAAMQELDRRNG